MESWIGIPFLLKEIHILQKSKQYGNYEKSYYNEALIDVCSILYQVQRGEYKHKKI
jgi:hypothetical protein